MDELNRRRLLAFHQLHQPMPHTSILTIAESCTHTNMASSTERSQSTMSNQRVNLGWSSIWRTLPTSLRSDMKLFSKKFWTLCMNRTSFQGGKIIHPHISGRYTVVWQNNTMTSFLRGIMAIWMWCLYLYLLHHYILPQDSYYRNFWTSRLDFFWG